MLATDYSNTGETELESLKGYAAERGSTITTCNRGPKFQETNNAGRFEIWLEQRDGLGRSNDKIAFG